MTESPWRPIQLFDPASSTFTYLLFDPSTREAVIIDPVEEQLARDLEAIQAHGLKLIWSVETHAHADHITSAGRLVEHTGARSAAPAGCGTETRNANGSPPVSGVRSRKPTAATP